MLKQKYFLTGIFILSAERQPIKLAWRKIVWLHECERIFSSVPIHFGKGVSLTHGASIYCTGVGDDIYIGDNNIIGGELILFPGARIGNRCVFGTGTIIGLTR